jgi:hypothetical protein
MIFSPVLSSGLKDGSLEWLNRTVNLLNVAVTRARVTLIIVGDLEFCLSLPPANKYRRLAEYAQRQPGRIIHSIDDLPMFKGEPLQIIGKLTNPSDRPGTRATLRQLILSCQEFVWWLDKYMSDAVFQLLSDISEHPEIGFREVRILASAEQCQPVNGNQPALSMEEAWATAQTLKSRNIVLRLAILPASNLPHDRFLYSRNHAINMPPIGGTYGNHGHVSEYTQSATGPQFFENYWNQAEIVALDGAVSSSDGQGRKRVQA